MLRRPLDVVQCVGKKDWTTLRAEIGNCMVNDLIFIADGRPMEQNAGGYWNKGLEWFTSKAFIVHNAVIDEIDKSCFFFDLLHVRRLEYFKQQVHLVDGRRVRTLNSSTAIVLGGGRGKKLHVPSSNFGACLFVL